MKRLTLFYFVMVCTIMGCSSEETSLDGAETAQTVESDSGDGAIHFIALGDSYTVGEGVEAEDSWPHQLKNLLTTEYDFDISIDVIAETGFRVSDLMTAIRNHKFEKKYTLLSLLIGVNDQFMGFSQEQFRADFINLMELIQNTPNLAGARVFVVSIPDWGYTPFGENYDAAAITTEINSFNAVINGVCSSFQVQYINITEVSRISKNDWAYVVNDGLHPNKLMYSKWVEIILPKIIKGLKN